MPGTRFLRSRGTRWTEFRGFLRVVPLARALQFAAHVIRTASGFTLVEVSVATGVLVVTALGTAQLFGLALRQTIAARDRTLMTLVATRTLDQLAARSADGAIAAAAPDCLDRDCDGFADMAGEGGVVYARRWVVAFPPEHSGATAAFVVRIFRPETPGIRLEMSSLAEVRR